MNYLNQKVAKLHWIGMPPHNGKKAALLIPQFNESSNFEIERRLQYFKSVAEQYSSLIDVILIDDGSTDSSLEQITAFLDRHDYPFYLASVRPNANKVGALALASLIIRHEFVVLSDFDTDIVGYAEIMKALELLSADNDLMGCYFRMLPFEGKGIVFLYQQIEYALLRGLYEYHKSEGSVPVMPGAGACFKRADLLAIYREHSGLRNGEDREATLIGLKMGFKTYYQKNVLTLTRPPLTLKALIKQRVRWNLGYIETFDKERKYYQEQIREMTPIGVVSVLDILLVLLNISLPLVLLLTGFSSIRALLILLGAIYLTGIASCVYVILKTPKEFTEIRKKLVPSVLIYPVFKVWIGYFSWVRAIQVFIRKNKFRYYNRRKYSLNVSKIHK